MAIASTSHCLFWATFPSLRDPPTLLPTIIAGLQTYFDRALGANLLYRFERPQYAEIRRQFVTGPQVIVGQEREMSSIYGAEHFLRMLGRALVFLKFLLLISCRSESAHYGWQFYHGPRECWTCSRLREWVDDVCSILTTFYIDLRWCFLCCSFADGWQQNVAEYSSKNMSLRV